MTNQTTRAKTFRAIANFRFAALEAGAQPEIVDNKVRALLALVNNGQEDFARETANNLFVDLSVDFGQPQFHNLF